MGKELDLYIFFINFVTYSSRRTQAIAPQHKRSDSLGDKADGGSRVCPH